MDSPDDEFASPKEFVDLLDLYIDHDEDDDMLVVMSILEEMDKKEGACS